MAFVRGYVGTVDEAVAAVLINSSLNVWNGTNFVPYDDGDWSNYLIEATELPTLSGAYQATVPTGAEAGYLSALFFLGTSFAEIESAPGGLAKAFDTIYALPKTLAIGAIGTSAYSNAKAMIWNASGEVWDGSAFVDYVHASRAGYLLDTTEIFTSGVYSVSIPSEAAADVVRADFFADAISVAIVATAVLPATTPSDTTGVEIDYDPSVQMTQARWACESIPVVNGSGATIATFVPSASFSPVANEWEARIGTVSTNVITLESGSGLEIGETGQMTANLTIAQSNLLSPGTTYWIELWRVGPGDDYTYPVAIRKIDPVWSVPT